MSNAEDEAQELDGETALPAISYASPTTDDAHDIRLSRHDVACIIVRMIGVYVLLYSLQFLPSIFRYWGAPPLYQMQALLPFAVAAGIGVAVLFFSRNLSIWLLPRTAVIASTAPGSSQGQWMAMAFAVMGAYFVITSVPLLLWYVALIAMGPAEPYAPSRAVAVRSWDPIAGLVRHGAELIAGAWLFFGSKKLAAFWWRLRHPEFKQVLEVDHSGSDAAR
jgi:hypothetical protein